MAIGSVRGATLTILVAFLGTVIPTPSDASSPNLLGSWSTADAKESRFSCGSTSDEGDFVIGIVLSFLDQSDTGVAGSGSSSDGSTFDFSGSLSGSTISPGSFDGPVSSGSFSATASGDTLLVSYGGSDKDVDGCNFSGTAKLVRAAGVDSPNEAGTQTTSNRRTQNAARNYLQPLGTHLGLVMRKKSATGAKPVQGGFLLQNGSGLSAGEGVRLPFGLWGSYSRSKSDNSFSVTDYNADHNVFLGGIDFLPNDRVVVGVALGYESTDTTTNFNSGRQKYDAFTIGPYVGVLLNDWLSADFTAAWSVSWFDQWRTNSITGAQVTSDPDGTRGLLAGNLNATKAIDDFLFTGHVGMLWAQDAVEAFSESDGTLVERNASRLGQVRAGAEVAYAAGNFEPYFAGTYEYDYSTSGLSLSAGLPQPSDDDSGFFMNAGVRYFSGDFTGSLEYSRVLGRSDFKMDTFMLLLRGEF